MLRLMARAMNHEKINRRVVPGFYSGIPHMPKPRYREDPATEKQIEYLQVLRANRRLEPLDKIECLKMTKSEAHRHINALKATST